MEKKDRFRIEKQVKDDKTTFVLKLVIPHKGQKKGIIATSNDTAENLTVVPGKEKEFAEYAVEGAVYTMNFTPKSRI